MRFLLATLRGRLEQVIRDVLLAVRDWKPMQERMKSSVALMTDSFILHRPGDTKESVAFLNWAIKTITSSFLVRETILFWMMVMINPPISIRLWIRCVVR